MCLLRGQTYPKQGQIYGGNAEEFIITQKLELSLRAEFNINLDRGMFAVGQRITEMHQGFMEHVVRRTIFPGLFFFASK